MPERRIYAGYYRRHDGKLIYVVTVAKDTDTDEDMVIWTPASYSNPRKYFTTSKKSFCEYITIDGTRRAKYKRQTQMKIPDAVIEVCEENCFRGPVRKEHTRFTDEYDSWEGIRAASYYDYAKKPCEQYRFCVKKYRLCVAEKRYIGISKSDFIALKEDLTFLKNCMKTVLRDYKEYFDERFIHGLSIRKYAKAHDLNRVSAPVIKCKKTPRKKCSFVAEVKGKR